MAESKLIKYLKEIEDPRIDRNKLHSLLDILVISITAVICGADNWNEIEDFGKAKENWFRQFLELNNGIPSHDTFNRVFQRLSPRWLNECSIEFFKEKLNEKREHIAIDGKTVRRSGSKTNNKSALHIVSAWMCKSGISLGQLKVEEKSNEIIAIPELLEKLEIKNSIISIDAMGTQKEIAEKIISKQGDYVLALKNNHPRLYASVSNFFEKNYANGFKDQVHKYSKSEEKAHGRIEKREYWMFSEIDWLEQKNEWAGFKSIGVARNEVIENSKVSIEHRYYITSLKNSPVLFRDSVRKHWGIENSCHWVLDMAFREDESRARKEFAGENFTLLRKIALNLLKQEKTAKVGIKGKRLKAGWDVKYFSKVVGLNEDDTIDKYF